MLAAPRGLGKSQVAPALAVALATGGKFRGEEVRPMRVFLVDRDNPKGVVWERLRAWGADKAPALFVLTREDAPSLKDKVAWDKFPVDQCEVVIIDSIGASTEGVTEKEGKQTSEILATLLDLSMRGPAVLLLNNTDKTAANFKGREEWAARVDILDEIRDATGFVPSGERPWWQELPEDGAKDWAKRSARRKGRIDYRLAFVPSKFRLAQEPEPFCVEIHLPEVEPWTLRDVPAGLLKTGEEVKAKAEQVKRERLEQAATALTTAVNERNVSGTPLQKTEAEEYLCGKPWELKRAKATIFARCRGLKVRWAPTRGASCNAPVVCHRCRHRLTVVPLHPSRCPRAAFCHSGWWCASNTIWAR